MNSRRLLVVGAANGSLGQAIAAGARMQNWEVVGTTHSQVEAEGDKHLRHVNVGNIWSLDDLFENEAPFDSVVYAAGVNEGKGIFDINLLHMHRHMEVNFYGAMHCLSEWLQRPDLDTYNHFVTISSNSAAIARTGSYAYCASKAAVTAGMRSAAREVAKETPNKHPQIYVYEPGFISNTKGSQKRVMEFEGPAHRMPGYKGKGLDKRKLASMILTNMSIGMTHLNGCVFRVDGGEQ